MIHPLRTTRVQNGWSIRGLAKKLQISASFLSDVELGRRRLSTKLVRAAAKVLKCSPDALRPSSPQHVFVCENCGIERTDAETRVSDWCYHGKYLES